MKLFPQNRYRRLTLLLLFCGYICTMLFGGCADRLILYPTTEPVLSGGISRGPDIPMTSGKVEVWTARARALQDAQPQGYVLTFIGNASRAEYESAMVAEEWEDQPVEVWSVNYPGYGGSTGPAKLASIPPAALAAYDALAVRAAGRPIFVSGTSLGTTAALYVAAHRNVAGLVLRNPPPLRNLILGRYGWWNLWLLSGPVALGVPSELDSIANAKASKVPAVFILAGKDSTVPPRYQAKVVNAYGGVNKTLFFPDSDHNDAPSGRDAAKIAQAVDWLWATAKNSR